MLSLSSASAASQQNEEAIKRQRDATEAKARQKAEAEAEQAREQEQRERRAAARKQVVAGFLSSYDKVGIGEIIAEFEASAIFMELVAGSQFYANHYQSVGINDPAIKRFFHRFIFETYLRE